MARGLWLAALLLLASAPLCAEEFHLKDGTRIVGKVVGYEKDAFRVETSFGIAIIYKDRIQRIVFDGSSPTTAPGSQPAAATPAPPSSLPEPPAPTRLVENVSATSYVSETYGFRIFKPPTWRSYPQLVRPQTPLVAALGTPDESTLLLIGREPFNGSLADYTRGAERLLQQFYEDYRPQKERPTQVAGLSALERGFTGQSDGRFWTGTAVYFARGRYCYTLLGLTTAGETASFQQSLLRKVANSWEFLPE
ncbi:MAG TPA: hypothetical protein VGA39_01815 [Candidatus Acidoferrales bacterium]